jgi:ABC-type antimicrobial peptide transport system permease subunit
MDDRITAATAARRFQTLILTTFAATALVLSLVGLYALMAYSVRQRTAEIGVRMALGANPSSILRLILGHGIKLAIGGAVLGLLGGFALSRVIARFLFGVRPLDPLTLVASVALFLIVALIACVIPAKRAAAVDPMVALRHE